MAALSEQEEFELLSLERERAFASTPGGAAVGNPNIMRQGALSSRGPSNLLGDVVAPIAGAGAMGGALGYASGEILQGLGGGLRMIPTPITQRAGGALMGTGQLLKGSRGLAATSGAIAGATGEPFGLVAEAAGAGPFWSEVARAAGGGGSAELAKLGKDFVVNVWAKVPKLSLEGQAAKALFKAVQEKMDGGVPHTLTEAEKKFVDEQVALIRGGAKTDAPLESVGSIMGLEGMRLMGAADQKMIAAQAQAAGMKPTFAGAKPADIGEQLQGTINTRYKGALEARKQEYAANEAARDNIVAMREKAQQFVNKTPEYDAVVRELRAELEAGKRSPSVQASYRKILDDLTNPELDVFGQAKPLKFQALDDVRRKLGDAFRGKPAEGYDAIGETAAKDLYGKVSNIQEKYAGAPQRKLLDDYAQRTEGLEIFSSKYGKKSTALDQYREDTFANDPSSLPAAYFKTRKSVQALKELTGNPAMVNHAALEHANRELAGKDAAAVRKWMGENSEWLAETGFTRKLIDNYASGLESAERSMTGAKAFAEQAAKDSAMLTRQSLPAQRAVDLIKSGDTELWAKVTPAIVRSPQAKEQMVNAVRQVVADQATSKTTAMLFNRNIRPFLENAGVATKAEMDFITQKLEAIAKMAIPEAEKLGLGKRLLLQSTGGWFATAGGRGVAWAADKMVPD